MKKDIENPPDECVVRGIDLNGFIRFYFFAGFAVLGAFVLFFFFTMRCTAMLTMARSNTAARTIELANSQPFMPEEEVSSLSSPSEELSSFASAVTETSVFE